MSLDVMQFFKAWSRLRQGSSACFVDKSQPMHIRWRSSGVNVMSQFNVKTSRLRKSTSQIIHEQSWRLWLEKLVLDNFGLSPNVFHLYSFISIRIVVEVVGRSWNLDLNFFSFIRETLYLLRGSIGLVVIGWDSKGKVVGLNPSSVFWMEIFPHLFLGKFYWCLLEKDRY